MTPAPDHLAPARIGRGTAEFRRTNLALFAAGWATFAVVYCVQPLMPLFVKIFGSSPAESSLAVSLTTGSMAVSLLFMGAVSDRFGRKGIMSLSLLCSASLTLALAFSGNFLTLLFLRGLIGIAISGVPAVAMAYLGEEMEPGSLGLAMGLYIAGSALGGMTGRLFTAAIADLSSWRVALGVIGVLSLLATYLFWRGLPVSRGFQPRPLNPREQIRQFRAHWTDKGLFWLFIEPFLLMGSFITFYNYIGFHLMQPPFNLSQTEIGIIFSVYLAGIVSSTWAGMLADRYGRRRMLWLFVAIFMAGLLLSLSTSLWALIGAVAIVTFGFFGAHSIASSWVGRRAGTAKAQASSIYLFLYYLGSSVIGTWGGFIWAHHSWTGVVAVLCGLLGIALIIALRLSKLAPLPVVSETALTEMS